MDDKMAADDPMERLEHKIDSLAEIVNAGFGRVDTRLTRVLGIVETRLGSVEGTLREVSTKLTDVERRLVNVEILAGETKTFSRNAWDSLTSLRTSMDEGFKEAKKDREERFDVVHKAIRHWGGRVDTLETAPPRATKRRP